MIKNFSSLKGLAVQLLWCSVFCCSSLIADVETVTSEQEALKLSAEDRDLLVKMYTATYPEDDERAAQAMIKSALDGDHVNLQMVGWLYRKAKHYEKSRFWYQKAHAAGNEYGMVGYADLMIQEKGGPRDLDQGLSIYKRLLKYGRAHSSTFYLYTLNTIYYDFHFQTDIVKLYWYEYFSNHKINIKNAQDTSAGSRRLYNHVAEAYEDSANPFSESFVYGSDEKDDNKLHKARIFYKKARNIEKISSINAVISGSYGVKEPKLSKKKINHVCQQAFNHSARDFQEFLQAQQKILTNPLKHQSIAKDYHAKTQKRYGIQRDNASLNFLTISLKKLINIYLNFAFDISSSSGHTVKFDKRMDDIYIMSRMQDRSFTAYINILIEHYGISATCENTVLEFTLPDSPHPPGQLITSHLITQWDGDFILSNLGLTGKGQLSFEGTFGFHGEVENNLPKEKGKYVTATGETILEGESFANGMLSGIGQVFMSGNKIYTGDLQENDFSGSGEFSKERYRYTGELIRGEPHGLGRMEHLLRNKNQTRMYYYPLDQEAPIISFYEGEFNDGKKHGKGNCGIKNKDGNYDEFRCKFYQDNLIMVNDISLLPPGASTATHFDTLLP